MRAASGDAARLPENNKEERYRALVAELAPLSTPELRAAAAARPTELLDSGFLFWLRDREGGGKGALGPAAQAGQPGAAGLGSRTMPAAEREALARLGQELTMMREWEDERQSRTLLPPLAASLAYSNLQRWREETGGETPQLVAGVDLEQLYKLGEQEERKLRESLESGGGGGGLRPRKEQQRSSIEEFTKHNKAYADLAAGAMARVRSRLMGFDDNGPRAAAEVLQALTRGMGSTEERATFLPDAFTPPGLQVSPQPRAAGAGGGKPSFVVTTPQALLEAIRARREELQAQAAQRQQQQQGAAPAEQTQREPQQQQGAEPAAPKETLPWRKKAPAAGAAAAEAQGMQKQGPERLPSGEDEEAVLCELAELVEEYDRVVFSRKTPLERMGHSSWP